MVKHGRVSARAGRAPEDAGGSPSDQPRLLDAYVHRPRVRRWAFVPLALPPTLRERHEGSRGPRSLPVLSESRPRTRGECVDGPRPCPWVSCRHHLYLDVTEPYEGPGGGVRSTVVTSHLGELEDLPETCSLDVADRGVNTLEQISQLFGVVRERVRQIEAKALDQPSLRRLLKAWKGHATEVDMARGELPQGVATSKESLR